ncbi:MAG: hypothetical protein ACFFD4_34050 [Candidatus Odinarchaeota archaeon]
MSIHPRSKQDVLIDKENGGISFRVKEKRSSGVIDETVFFSEELTLDLLDKLLATRPERTRFIIRGTPKRISKKLLKSLLYATDCILSLHNEYALRVNILVRLKKAGTMGKAKKSKCNSNAIGVARSWLSEFDMQDDLDIHSSITTIIHEVFHVYFRFNSPVTEKCTSTLVSKFKTDVVAIADILLRNYQRHAAFKAHRKLSYLPKDEDHYDKAEHERIDLPESFKKHIKH